MVGSTIRRFIQHEAAGGLCLIATAVLAMIFANLPLLHDLYHKLTGPVALLVVNDGLMAVFFLLVGLELKREIVIGELSSRQRLLQPLLAAIGGMAVPSLIFVAINIGSPEHLRGWAIPSATDIAFALGILTLLGSRIPKSVKVLLTAVAILDDLGAILVIAFFYSHDLQIQSLLVALISAMGLILLNRRGTVTLWPYLLCGALIWAGFFMGGIHPTLAGVITALAIPLRDRSDEVSYRAPLYRLEHKLHHVVAFVVLPVFAFMNAGLPLQGLTLAMLAQPLTLGVLAGLLVGKPLGIMGGLGLGHVTGLARRGAGEGWQDYLVMAFLCGIGFTMALFIGDLAFTEPALRNQVKLGILAASVLAAALGLALGLTRRSR